MIRKLISAALSILLLIGLPGCAADLGTGIIKELEAHKEGISQELGELWDAFLEEASEWPESSDSETGIIKELEEHREGISQVLDKLWDAFLEEASEWPESSNPENREE